MKRFRLSTLAEADLDEIWLYAAGDRSVDVANRLIDDILGGMVLLASHPKADRLRDEIAPRLRSYRLRRLRRQPRRFPCYALPGFRPPVSFAEASRWHDSPLC